MKIHIFNLLFYCLIVFTDDVVVPAQIEQPLIHILGILLFSITAKYQ